MAHLQYISWLLMYNASGDKRNPYCIGSEDCIHDDTGMWIYPSVSLFLQNREHVPWGMILQRLTAQFLKMSTVHLLFSLIVVLKLCNPGFNFMCRFLFYFRSAQYEHTGFSWYQETRLLKIFLKSKKQKVSHGLL